MERRPSSAHAALMARGAVELPSAVTRS
jgi:hypothetical protein